MSVEAEYRDRIRTFVSDDELRALSVVSLRDSLGAFAVVWLEIAVLIAGVHLAGQLPLPSLIAVGIVLVLLIASRINALNVLMHEASHGFLAEARRTNDRLCNAGAAWWMLHSVEEYRPAHRLHHRYLNTANDPDLDSYLIPSGRWSLARMVAADLVGLTALRRVVTLLSASDAQETKSPAARPWNLAGKAMAQLVILTCFMAFEGILRGAVLYVVFWVLPILCLFPVILRLKTIAEHFDPRLRSESEGLWVVRTSVADRLQNHLLGARMEFHFEHHVFPTIPFPGLKRLHATLVERGFFSDLDRSPAPRPSVLSGGYVAFTRRLSAFRSRLTPSLRESGEASSGRLSGS